MSKQRIVIIGGGFGGKLQFTPEEVKKENREYDHDYGISWIHEYGKGRVFNCAMGHTPTLFATPSLAQMMLGGIQFVLGDLEADATPSAKLPKK